MTTQAVVDWLVYWLPKIALPVGAAWGLFCLVFEVVYQATRGARQFEAGARAGLKYRARLDLDDDESV